MAFSLKYLDLVLANDTSLVDLIKSWTPELLWIWPAPLLDPDSRMTAIVMMPPSRVLGLVPVFLSDTGVLELRRSCAPAWVHLSADEVETWMTDANNRYEARKIKHAQLGKDRSPQN